MKAAESLRNRRSAFTLVEMLVAAALTIFIMVLLTGAFQQGLETFRTLKAIGDLQARLQAATTTLRADLAAQHFEEDPPHKVGKYLNDTDPTDLLAYQPPSQGYFRIWQGPVTPIAGLPDCWPEGSDPDGNISTRAVTHSLAFTAKRGATSRSDMFVTYGGYEKRLSNLRLGTASPNPAQSYVDPVDFAGDNPIGQATMVDPITGQTVHYDTERTGDTIFYSRWAELAYFLQETGETTPGGQKRYGLYRRERLLVPPGRTAIPPSMKIKADGSPEAANVPTPGQLPHISHPPSSAPVPYLNSPIEVTIPFNRMGMEPGSATGAGAAGRNRVGGLPPTTHLYVAGATHVVMPYDGEEEAAALLLPDVLSFEVKVAGDGFPAAPTDPTKEDPTYRLLPTNTHPQLRPYRVFDTWTKQDVPVQTHVNTRVRYDTKWNTTGQSESMPLRSVRIRSLQIRIRVWDVKSQQTRQVTIIQDV